MSSIKYLLDEDLTDRNDIICDKTGLRTRRYANWILREDGAVSRLNTTNKRSRYTNKWHFAVNCARSGSLGRYGAINIDRVPILIHKLMTHLYIGYNDNRDIIIDHINGDTFDNHINNLRYTTQSKNLLNTYKHRAKGITDV